MSCHAPPPNQRIGRPPPYAVTFPATVILYQTRQRLSIYPIRLSKPPGRSVSFSLTFRAVSPNIKGRECHGCGSLPKQMIKPAQVATHRAGLLFCSYNQMVRRASTFTIKSTRLTQSINLSYLVIRTASQSKNWKAAAFCRDVPRHSYFVSDKGNACQHIPARLSKPPGRSVSFSLTFRAVSPNIKGRECHGCGSLPEFLLKARSRCQPCGGLTFSTLTSGF